LLVVLVVALGACSSSTSSGTPSLRPAIVQGRPVLQVYSPNDDPDLTCPPDSCPPSDLDARTITLAGFGSSYRLGPAFFTEDQVASASAVSPDDGLTWVVDLTLDTDGTQGLETATMHALGVQPEGQIATVVDGRVVAAPVVQAAIDSGRIELSGFTQDEAQHLADQLNA
jgi:preprotein translocase subunit SecD